MLDAKLETEGPRSTAERKKELLAKLNNLVMAAVGVYAEAADRTQYAQHIRGIINNACELGGQFERENHDADAKTPTRPSQPTPTPEPTHQLVDATTAKKKAQEAATKL